MMEQWVEVALRSLAGFVILLVISRVFVRKPIGESSPFEFSLVGIVAIIIALGSFQLALPVRIPLTALAVWGILILGASLLNVKSAAFRSFVTGDGIPIIKDGKILEDNMKKQRLTTDELLKKLRSKDVFQYADVEFAVLEGNGELNILTKKEQQPITPKVLNKTVAPIKEPETVVMDGKILDEPLATRGLSRDWLHTELAKMNANLNNVFLAQVDEYGQLSIDLYDDIVQVPQPVELPLLGASIKKVQADLALYALDTENPEAKKMYKWCAKQMDEVDELLSPYTSQ
ncbi:DUF421 domain-containing protein [Salipaludibacillus aurantiacus]|uniref:Uncharacterized membrane protein YcaP, DUF421 family n=1 Tax=Salipaludibacillus aurantiacus TaxID=1601833 RepID=A0A1H9TVF1_9BACI|nr:DUF421 domain-containing protein [Salipaludibacillus aurantiacus]SES00964.1 Uncharacterized membrane protein YcaP, DUF421 family [Salipaludibacillus aurantiacus]